ncbi:MAG TPA: pseudouridine synthase [Desulfobacteria bacterium]|nr:pseudouridine synthase [Desulfobacteria bacterium]
MLERLQKFLAHAGIASRRTCEELISSGKVKVNGLVVREMGVKVDPEKDRVEVAGKDVKIEEEKYYLVLNKPTGYVTTLRDPQKRPKVGDLLKDVKARVYPVGRLDFDTSGLLLMTNDGDITYRLTHPKHEIGKTYIALVKGVPDQDKLKRFQKGLRLADGTTAPAKIRLLKKQGSNCSLEITIYEGRNRQIRRMCETIGHPVIELKRVSMGFLNLDGLEAGKYRYLTRSEIAKLKKLTEKPV